MLPPITEIGHFNKPHGINGEISATVDVDLSALRCIVVDVDGIEVPFFITSLRPKNGDTVLVKLDGYNSDEEIKPFTGKTIYALADEVADEYEDGDEEPDGFYASDFIGFRAIDDSGAELGEITDIDDNTANVLFIIEQPGRERPLLIPVADEMITDIDTEQRTVTFDLPEGITTL